MALQWLFKNKKMAAAFTSEYGTAEDDIRKLPSICPTATFAMVYLIDESDARARGCVCGFGYLIGRLLFFFILSSSSPSSQENL